MSEIEYNLKHPAIRYHGGKWRLAPWIISFFKEHRCYVEPFGGAAGVLLRKPRSYAEVYNDLDGEIVNLFRVLQNEEQCKRLQELCILTPYHREEFLLAYEPALDPIEMARRTVVRACMGFGSAGATKQTMGFRIDSKREYSLASHLWTRFPANIACVGERFAGVIIENRPAIQVMQHHDEKNTLHYVDPPYLHSTRKMGNRAYSFEMSDQDHIELLTAVKQLKGMVVISGYNSELYNDMLKDWSKHTKQAQVSAYRGTGIRTECIWINY
ncbi:DNA adenine methylase [Gilliamella sp. Occ4-3]|uniref:DNA adenine methylase n=1 Tax=Gilliamella sp. Occ4-3 TaxID=3120254 RepID=UPI00080DC32B|nr:DNA adenine methylase [Gilliamella apicola]OCG72951.1 DNA methyltransferase [Gilliamella apicola]